MEIEIGVGGIGASFHVHIQVLQVAHGIAGGHVETDGAQVAAVVVVLHVELALLLLVQLGLGAEQSANFEEVARAGLVEQRRRFELAFDDKRLGEWAEATLHVAHAQLLEVAGIGHDGLLQLLHQLGAFGFGNEGPVGLNFDGRVTA